MIQSFPPPDGFLPTVFEHDIPFVNNFFQTYERHCDDCSEIGAWVTEECCNAGRMAHGAFLMAIGDFATTKATFRMMGTHNRFSVHMNFNMNFYAAAPKNSWLVAKARVTRAGSSIVYTTCDYYADGELIGHADAILKSTIRREKTPKPG